MSLESRASSVEKEDAYVRNSSFLSRDIEAQKTFAPKNSSPKRNITPPKNTNITSNTTPPRNLISPPKRAGSIVTAKKEISGSPPKKEENNSPPTNQITSPPQKETSPPVSKNVFATLQNHNEHKDDNLPSRNNIITLSTKVTSTSTPKADKMTSFSGGVTSNIIKFNKVDVNNYEDSTKNIKDLVMTKEIPIKTEKLSLPAPKNNEISEMNDTAVKSDQNKEDIDNMKEAEKSEETNGVGDKIRKFEKAAEDASASVGRLSRPGSVRRGRTDRLCSDSKDDLPPPATPFKDNIFFDSATSDKVVTNSLNHKNSTLERQHSIKGSNVAKWQRNESSSIEDKIQKPEPQKIIKPEFKPMQSPVDLTIRSPSLGAKIPDQFPSQGTAFRNVASPDTARSNINKVNEDNLKAFKLKNKQKLCVSKGTSYFSRVSDEVWLVKKKDIEEIEERVLDSFRRAGGNVCMRSETMRPSSDSGQGASFTHATMGRKRQMYARSESLDPQWAGARAQTLKRQSSVACTCGHDKKTKGKNGPADTTPRPRSRSHGDENNQSHVLDKYETLV